MFCGCVKDVCHLHGITTLHDDLAFYLHNECTRDPIVGGLTEWLDGKFKGNMSLLADKIEANADQYPLVLGDHTMFMIGDNFIAITDVVKFIRPCDMRHTLDRKGWYLALTWPGETAPWQSERMKFSRIRDIDRVFSKIADRLEEENPPVFVSDSDWLMIDE